MPSAKPAAAQPDPASTAQPDPTAVSATGLPDSVAATQALLARGDYVAGVGLSTAIYLALTLGRPLLLEGEPGVGKTEVARVLARVLGRPLVRLQCYEGLDLAQAAYDWNYTAQMVHIRAAEAGGHGTDAGPDASALEESVFGARFLLARPLLQTIRLSQAGTPPVLLIDELDRSDEPFEAFLLEFLEDWQLSIPEYGTVRAPQPPITVLTSNRTRDIHDALRRRCLYHWIDFPSAEVERRIVQLKAPGAGQALTDQVVAFVQSIRGLDLYKHPGIAESITWAQALTALNHVAIDPETVGDTLGTLLKYQDDISRVMDSQELQRLAAAARAAQTGPGPSRG